MWRDVSLSYRGALEILGHHDRPALDRLNGLLGGGVLAAGVASLAVGAPGPAALLAAVWGWIDQKNEAASLLRAVLDGVRGKLLGLEGYERHQLITAAHTTIVASSLFEVLREEAKGLRLLAGDEETLTTGEWLGDGERLFDALYRLEVPIPSATRGFHDNLGAVAGWLEPLGTRTLRFLRLTGTGPLPETRAVLDKALERYRTRYLGLAAAVPEFFVWASLDEHAATRHTVTNARAELREAFRTQGSALARIERLLSLDLSRRETSERDVAGVVANANRGELSEPVVPMDARHDAALAVPTVEQIYVGPHCRFAAYVRDGSRPASEEWWQEQRFSRHLDLLLTAHLTSPAAFERPLLLLGHPGAGKSLLTKVLAARLPSASYTVVRVPLRRVNADDSVLDQIQAALDLATNRRAQWWEVARASPRAVRVVLLDGLDELLQAASGGRDRRGYLQEIIGFQQKEARQGMPVAVIVTSRTVVADRVLITDGTPIVKLEDFDDGQIAQWLDRWNRVNEAAAAAGRVRRLTLTSVSDRPDLAELVKQPLLLLMLALYAADPAASPIETVMSTSALYRLLLDEFARREAGKSPVPLSEKAVAAAAESHLWRLTVAAFAMVNRGRQDITDAELGADLIALEERQSEAPDVAEIGRDLVGRFFFVHRAEARTGNEDSVRRCYEFLHATFGEYLVAAHVVDTLRALAATPALPGRAVDDGFLYALLSHQPFSDRPQILTFAAELFDELPEPSRKQVAALLEKLVSSVRQRPDTGRHASYRPTPLDRVRHLAAYSLNLVLLRVRMAPMLVAEVFGEDLRAWRSTVTLWSTGLDPEQLDGVLDLLAYRDGQLGRNGVRWMPEYREALLARLAGDKMLEERLRLGLAIQDGLAYRMPDDSWDQGIAAWLIMALFRNRPVPDSDYPDQDAPSPRVAPLTRLIDVLLVLRGHQMDHDDLLSLLNLRLRLADQLSPDPAVLAATLLNDPAKELVELVLPHVDLARHPRLAVLLCLAAHLTRNPGVARLFEPAIRLSRDSPYWLYDYQLDVLHDIIKIFRWPDEPTLP
ncbi:AAA family ATPase [Nonomuraea sp. PA05]|uniref:NACHT domain-containing protein n=1 Tax=Nonomuraea sp. PA05 TaxID=2604466 RepID=UPI0011D84E4A|nr:AAA family ATPase [Nonomuraea sp. PA05]TYB70961.1 AAA family ATPase [Nonomuraea sp. PA05]